MTIVCPLFAVLLAALSAVGVQQARRAWRDPAWVPAATRQPAASTAASAGVMISFTVLLAGGSVLVDVPGAGRPAGAALALVGVAGVIGTAVAVSTTRRYGRPRFLVPPPHRTSGPPAAQPTATPGPVPPPPRATTSTPSADPPASTSTDPSSTSSPTAPIEFTVIAGAGRYVSDDTHLAGRLVLTTERLLLTTRTPDPDRSWPVDGLRAVEPGPGEDGFTLRFDGETALAFAVDKQRDLWLSRIDALLAQPRPVLSWYGDPPDDGPPATAPDGMAVLVLLRAEGERQDRTIGYRVLLDRRPVGRLRHGQRLEVPLPPGRHTLALRSTWVGSSTIAFQAEPGQVLRFGCEPGGFPGMTRADMERDPTGYLRLRRLPG